MYTQGLGVALQSPPAPVRTLVCGLLLLIAMYFAICYIWTPTIVLAPAIFLQGFSIGPVIVAAGNVVTANAKVAEVNDISTTYFFLRQLGNSFEVTPATLMFDRRMTLHSSRLLDVCVRLDAATRSAVVPSRTLGLDPTGIRNVRSSSLLFNSFKTADAIFRVRISARREISRFT